MDELKKATQPVFVSLANDDLPTPSWLAHSGLAAGASKPEFCGRKNMVPPDVREPNFWYVFIPPSLSCVSRGLQACRLRLTGVFVLAYIERDSCRPLSVRDLPGFGPWRFAGGSEKQTSTPSLVGGRAPCGGSTH